MASAFFSFRHPSSVIRFVFCAASAVSLALATPAHAATLIRDAELEDTLRQFGNPIFETAGLKPDAVHIFIVGDNIINAYVAGGQNLFLFTGLILVCDNPNMLLGVLAHETGHIAGGHLARGAEDLKDAQLGAILGYVLGAAIGVAGGGDAGMAVVAGTQNVVQRKMLAYSRGHEQAADEAALRFLDTLGISASGMIETFNVLRRDELRAFGTRDPYLQTHPLSGERISYIREHVEHSAIPAGAHPKTLDAPLARMRAKLYAFLNIPPKTFARYPASDTSVAARMARAIAWHKMPDIDHATDAMQKLIKDYPNDPFLYDLYGQILFESGRIKGALPVYEKAAALKPDSPLILTSLGQVQLAVGKTPDAIVSLLRANNYDKTNAQTWHLLATAYGKQRNAPMASLALAEEALLQNQPKIALQQANAALKDLSPDNPAAIHAEDIKREAEELRRKEKEDDE